MTHRMCAPRTAGCSVPASAAFVLASGAMREPVAVVQVAQHDRVAVAFGQRPRDE